MGEPGRGEALARAALAGNPSDGFGGAVLALAFSERRAAATVSRGTPDAVGACEPDVALVRATVARFAAELCPDAAGASVRWCSDIPRSVGLGGSSAIIIAVLRALARVHAVTIEPAPLAALALSIEVDDLGIAAGLQDRVAQAYGGLTFMDFGVAPPVYTRLDPGALPPLLIAWRGGAGGDSGAVHSPLRDRFLAGDTAVRHAMRALMDHAHAAAAALAVADHGALRAAVDGSFDARRSMLALDPRHVEMIETARAGGAAANYTGSGGAVVAVCDDAGHRERVAAALAQRGVRDPRPDRIAGLTAPTAGCRAPAARPARPRRAAAGRRPSPASSPSCAGRRAGSPCPAAGWRSP